MTLKADVPYDGNCFFSSVLEVVNLYVTSAKDLRANVCQYIRGGDCPESLKEVLGIEFLYKLALNYTAIPDQRAIEATSCMLDVLIVVHTVDPSSSNAMDSMVTNIHGCVVPEVHLENVSGQHFVPLVEIVRRESGDAVKTPTLSLHPTKKSSKKRWRFRSIRRGSGDNVKTSGAESKPLNEKPRVPEKTTTPANLSTDDIRLILTMGLKYPKFGSLIINPFVPKIKCFKLFVLVIYTWLVLNATNCTI